MQLRSPTREVALIRRLPEAGDQRAQQQHLQQRHLRVRRHLETAELDQSQTPGRTVRRIQFVDAELGAVRIARQIDQQITQQSIHQPRLQTFLPGFQMLGHLLKGDLQLVKTFEPGFVHTRCLTGGADEYSREQIRQSGMVLPIRDQTHQHIGTTQAG